MKRSFLTPACSQLRCLLRVASVWWCSLIASCSLTQEGTIQPADNFVHVGDRLPHFVITMNDGSLFCSSMLNGKPSLIVFFSTQCKDCQRELPALNQRYLAHAHDTTFVAIAREQSAADIADYWAANKLSLPYSAQPDRRIYQLFARKGIPRIYISNAEGIVQNVIEAW